MVDLTPSEARILLMVLDRSWVPTMAYGEYRSALGKIREAANAREDLNVGGSGISAGPDGGGAKNAGSHRQSRR